MLRAAFRGSAMPTHEQVAQESGPDSHIAELRDRQPAAVSLDQRLAAIERRLAEQRPAWSSTKALAILGSVIAAVVPATTAIDGYLKWRSDLAVSAEDPQSALALGSAAAALSQRMGGESLGTPGAAAGGSAVGGGLRASAGGASSAARPRPAPAPAGRDVEMRQEYLTAKRKSEVAAIKANASVQRLTGLPNSVKAENLKSLTAD
jgi:hypothetical protein